MGCKACERRRKALAEKRRKKQEQGKPVQAAALGVVLAVSESAGKALGIHGEDPMFKTETTTDGTRVIRQVPGNHDHVGRGEMPEATKQLLQDLTGEVEDEQHPEDSNTQGSAPRG